MARFVLETNDPSERTCIAIRQAFSKTENIDGKLILTAEAVKNKQSG